MSANGWSNVGRTGWTNTLLCSLMVTLGIGVNDHDMGSYMRGVGLAPLFARMRCIHGYT